MSSRTAQALDKNDPESEAAGGTTHPAGPSPVTSDSAEPDPAKPDHTKPDLGKPGLLVMDVDATLIREEVIDLLGDAAGAGERIAAITARAMRGELDFSQSLRARVRLLRGLPVSVFDEVFTRVHVTPGARDLIASLHAHGWKVGVVSGGFHEIVDRLADHLGLDHWIANRLEVAHGALTGGVLGDIVTKETKREALERWMREDGLEPGQSVAVGDGANDIPMIRQAALGIAFCAKPVVREHADRSITTTDLMQVMTLLS
ncbi:MAG: phosphoserine phosphatase SerB [Bifidobacterium mongoliense]|jgi:phosphoserine phosphatase